MTDHAKNVEDARLWAGGACGKFTLNPDNILTGVVLCATCIEDEAAHRLRDLLAAYDALKTERGDVTNCPRCGFLGPNKLMPTGGPTDD